MITQLLSISSIFIYKTLFILVHNLLLIELKYIFTFCFKSLMYVIIFILIYLLFDGTDVFNLLGLSAIDEKRRP